MFKILLKSAVLTLIILSVYFIVHPSACSNMLAGRDTTGSSQGATEQAKQPSFVEDEMSLTAGESQTPAQNSSEEEGVFDTNTLQEEAQTFSQADIDYAIASRYVELEKEYAQTQPVGKDSAREISFIVMDDFEMSPTEWESFLSRATQTGLFDKVRKDMELLPSADDSSTVSVQ